MTVSSYPWWKSYGCGCGSMWCWIDGAVHALTDTTVNVVLPKPLLWVCNKHDEAIWKDFD